MRNEIEAIFRKRLRRQRISYLLFLFGMFIFPSKQTLDFDKPGHIILFVIAFIIFGISYLMWFFNNRCPSCERYLVSPSLEVLSWEKHDRCYACLRKKRENDNMAKQVSQNDPKTQVEAGRLS